MRRIIILPFVFALFFLACKHSKENANANILDFQDYIQYTTHGRISVIDPVNIRLSREVTKWKTGQDIEDEVMDIDPYVPGKLVLKAPDLLSFVPDEPLKPETEYTVKLYLDKIFDIKSGEPTTYTFSLITRSQDFVVRMGSVHSYSRDWLYIEGELRASDYIDPDKLKSIIRAIQDGKDLSVRWKESSNESYRFIIDSVRRKETDDEIAILWDGTKAGIDKTGSDTLLISGKENFEIKDIKVVQEPDQHIVINFSDPLQPGQNFKGLVRVENAKGLRYSADGNELFVFPSARLNGNLLIEILPGIKNVYGDKMGFKFQTSLTFEMLKPALEIIDQGVFLPNSKNLRVNFRAVNIQRVTVRVIKLFSDNVMQFLQNNELGESYDLKRVGRLVAKEKITLVENPSMNRGRWEAYSVDLSKLIKADPGAIYRVELDFGIHDVLYPCSGNSTQSIADEEDEEYEEDYEEDEEEFVEEDPENLTEEEQQLWEEEQKQREEAYWDDLLYSYKKHVWNWEQRNNPCHPAYYNDVSKSINVLGSNLGLIVKKGTNGKYYVTVTDIMTAEPVGGATVKLYNYQQQELVTVTTDQKGMASLDMDKNAFFAIASKGKSKTYLKLSENNSLSVSKFNVGGKTLEKGIKARIYGERGVWRPGDTIHLTFVINDKSNPLPKGHPIRFVLKDERGGVVYHRLNHYVPGTFYTYHIPTEAEAPTGTWHAEVHVGGTVFTKKISVATVKPNRIKIHLDLGKSPVLSLNDGISGTLTAKWLHGSPAANLKADVNMEVKATKTVFEGYENYIFNDPTGSFYSDEITVFEGKLDNNGTAKIDDIEFPDTGDAPGMLKAVFTTRVFEQGGGFSMDIFSKKISPFERYVGLLPAKKNGYGEYDTGMNHRFDVVLLDEKGEPVAGKNLELRVYKLTWDWWWNSSDYNLAHYVSSEYHQKAFDKNLRTDKNGKARFSLNIRDEEGGRYLIRVIDPEIMHATGMVTYFYKDWWRSPEGSNGQKPTMLMLSKDKKTYVPGDEIHLTFPSPATGNALISIENGAEVLSRRWVKTTKGETQVNIPVTKDMAPNVYLHVTLLQPHAATADDLPIRLYGIIPVKVENAGAHLQPVIRMPETLEPEKDYTLSVSEASGIPMTYTLAVVDEGLLDLTHFRTPDLYKGFNAKESLGVITWDMFDEVIGAYAGRLNQVFAIGGDEEVKIEKGKKPNRFKPVVRFMGPFRLKKGGKNTHKLHMPNYIGSVRVMVVAGNYERESYGSAEKAVPVKTPLMLLADAPRTVSPGERFSVPVSLFAMEDAIKDVQLHIITSKGFEVEGSKDAQVHFDQTGEKMYFYSIKAPSKPSAEKIRVKAVSGRHKAYYDIELSVDNPNPLTIRTQDTDVLPGASQQIAVNTFGTEGTNRLRMQIGTTPVIDFSRRIDQLIHYPHGCVEQTTSSVFPQLYLEDLSDLTGDKILEIKNNIKAGIKKLAHFQTMDGGMAYWRGQPVADDWGTSYAGHFMLEAEKKGYALPFNFKKRWIEYQHKAARAWRKSIYRKDLLQAYRLYTLALAGSPDLAAMNRLREAPSLNNEARWTLASAYALAGQSKVAREIVIQAQEKFDLSKDDQYAYRYSYGSPERDRAMALEVYTLLGESRAMDYAGILAKKLNSKEWYSTQTTAYMLMALSKFSIKNGGKAFEMDYSVNGKKFHIKTAKSFAIRDLPVRDGENDIRLDNPTDKHLYVRIYNTGKLPVGKETSVQRNLSLIVRYLDENGYEISPDRLKQGTDITAFVKVQNLTDDRVDNVALTQIFPGGWEIINTSFADGSTRKSSGYTDVRDDRIYEYFDLKPRGSEYFEVKLNAAYPGRYYLFGVQAEAMYDRDYMVRNTGKWVEVIR